MKKKISFLSVRFCFRYRNGASNLVCSVFYNNTGKTRSKCLFFGNWAPQGLRGGLRGGSLGGSLGGSVGPRRGLRRGSLRAPRGLPRGSAGAPRGTPRGLIGGSLGAPRGLRGGSAGAPRGPPRGLIGGSPGAPWGFRGGQVPWLVLPIAIVKKLSEYINHINCMRCKICSSFKLCNKSYMGQFTLARFFMWWPICIQYNVSRGQLGLGCIVRGDFFFHTLNPALYPTHTHYTCPMHTSQRRASAEG